MTLTLPGCHSRCWQAREWWRRLRGRNLVNVPSCERTSTGIEGRMHWSLLFSRNRIYCDSNCIFVANLLHTALKPRHNLKNDEDLSRETAVPSRNRNVRNLFRCVCQCFPWALSWFTVKEGMANGATISARSHFWASELSLGSKLAALPTMTSREKIPNNDNNNNWYKLIPFTSTHCIALCSRFGRAKRGKPDGLFQESNYGTCLRHI